MSEDSNINTNPNEEVPLDPIKRLSRDLKKAATTLSINEARYLVGGYYMIQEYRKASGNQRGALKKAEKPHDLITWFFDQSEVIELQIKKVLDVWSDTHYMGRWAKSVLGMGPVLSSGLLAHIDITKAPTVGHIWRFAGLDPTSEWKEKQKRPWNAALKTLCWKIGESFMKVSGREEGFYGKIWRERFELEWDRNLKGADPEQCKKALNKVYKSKYTPKWYRGQFDPAVVKQFRDEGRNLLELPVAEPGKGVIMLPPGHINARAKRYATKLFLSHWHYMAFKHHFGTEPPKPFVIEHLGHIHMIKPPVWEDK